MNKYSARIMAQPSIRNARTSPATTAATKRHKSAWSVLLWGVVGLDLGLEVLNLGFVGFGGLDGRQLVKQVENLEDRSPALLMVPVHGDIVCRNHARVGW